jgi:hypothetical protein
LDVGFNKLGISLLSLIMFISRDLLARQTVENFGWTKHLAFIARPFFLFQILGTNAAQLLQQRLYQELQPMPLAS